MMAIAKILRDILDGAGEAQGKPGPIEIVLKIEGWKADLRRLKTPESGPRNPAIPGD